MTSWLLWRTHQQSFARPAGLDQYPPLEQDVVPAVVIAVIGIGPEFDKAQMVKIGQVFDYLIVLVDMHQFRSSVRGENNIAQCRRGAGTLIGLPRA
jgi:hypothetical protein